MSTRTDGSETDSERNGSTEEQKFDFSKLSGDGTGGGTTVSDDVIVDGKIITAEN